MFTVIRVLRVVCVTWGLLVLSACGGGGGGGSGGGAGGETAAFAEFSEDVLPAGTRVDVSGQNLFVMAAGDQWQYERQLNGTTVGTVMRTVGAVSTDRRLVSEYDGSTGETVSGTYEILPEGLMAIDPLEVASNAPGLYAALPQLLEYPTPLYPAGAERRVLRQGNLRADIDGDGKFDSFRFDFRQVFRGFESLNVVGRDLQVARFSNTLVLTLRGTREPIADQNVTVTDEAYFAAGLGLVRSDRRVGSNVASAVVAAYRLVLTRATVGGVTYDAQNAGTQPVAVGPGNGSLLLTHADLVYDPLRARYYASIPSSVVGQGNRIATIDASSGAMTLSAAPVGSNPGALALSPDSGSLYVGLDGSGELLRLSLPDMVETGRVALLRDAFFGQYTADRISVSPADSRVVAVSLARPGVSPRHGGVVLVRDMVLQPQRTQEHTGSNSIAFHSSGAWVIGYNNETTEFGLRRLEVLADGLAERQVVATAGAFNVDIDVSADLVMVGGLAFHPDTLALRGTVASGISKCVRLRDAAKVACVGWQDQKLRVADTNTFSLLAEPAYAQLAGISTPRLVAGPVGQVALFDGREIRRISLPWLR